MAYVRPVEDPTITYLRHVLETKGWTPAEAARKAGVAHSTINRPVTIPDYPHGLSRQTLRKIYRVSQIDPTPFLDGVRVVDAPQRVENGDAVAPINDLVRVLDIEASAGDGMTIPDYEATAYSLAFPPGYLRSITSTDPDKLRLISVAGWSMAPQLKDGDVVLVDTSKRDLGFDGMFVVRHLDVLKVKRLRLASDRSTITLISYNAVEYPEEHWPMSDVEVIGRVLWRAGRV